MKKGWLVLAWLLSAGSLHAEDGFGRLSFSGIAGTIFSGASDASDESSPTDSGSITGIKLSYPLDMEVTSRVDGITGRRPEVEGVYQLLSASEWSGHIVRLDGIFPLPHGRKLVQFLTAGAGFVTFKADEKSTSGFLACYGGGIKYFFHDDLALRADLRHNFNTASLPVDMDYFEISAGLTYLFDRPDNRRPTLKAEGGEVTQTDTPFAESPPPAAAPDKVPVPQLAGEAQAPVPLQSPVSLSTTIPETAPAATPEVVSAVEIPTPAPVPLPAPAVVQAAVPEPAPNLAAILPEAALTVEPLPTPEPAPAMLAEVPKGDAGGDPAAAVPVSLPAPRVLEVPAPEGTFVQREFVVLFEFDKSEVGAADQEVIGEVAAAMKALPEVSAMIEGHTDSKGSDSYNVRLSRRRAQAARDLLVKAGISASRLQIGYFGESRPMADNRTDEGRRLNRRAVIIFLDSAQAEKVGPR